MPTDSGRTDSGRTEMGAGSLTQEPLAGVEAGLDALDAPRIIKPPRTKRFLARAFPPMLAVGLLLAVWQLVATLKVTRADLLPSPGMVFDSLRASWHDGTLGAALRTSMKHGAIGFLAAVALGTPFGLLVARVPFVRAAVKPLLSGLQSLPSVAWVVPAILWFHLSAGAIYFVILMGAVPSIALGLVSGLDQVPPLYLRVGRVLGARGLASARHVLLPAALPGYLAGLKQGWAFSWRSLMAAELIVNDPRLGFGLGQLLDQGRQTADISLAFAAVLAILAVGIAVDVFLFAPVERFVLARRGLVGR